MDRNRKYYICHLLTQFDVFFMVLAMSEIKVLYCAITGCTSPKTVHPAAEMCTLGAGCTLNFGHCT